jgi:hypothetical protein
VQEDTRWPSGIFVGDSLADVPRWLGYLWTLPNTAIGLLLGAFTFQLPRLAAGGVLVFDRTPRGITRLMPGLHRVAVTVGFVILAARPVTGQLEMHERTHVAQFAAWGPLFLPVYLLLAVPFGYRRHPMEVAARRAAGEQIGGR